MAWPEGVSFPPATLSTQHLRRPHSTTPNNSQDEGPAKRSIAGRVAATGSNTLDPKAFKKPRVQSASRTAARSSAQGKSPGPGLRCGNCAWPGDAPHALATPLWGFPASPPNARSQATPRSFPSPSPQGRGTGAIVTRGHRGPSGKLKAFPPSRLRSGTGFERYFI